jgi:hypothetical protein
VRITDYNKHIGSKEHLAHHNTLTYVKIDNLLSGFKTKTSKSDCIPDMFKPKMRAKPYLASEEEEKVS